MATTIKLKNGSGAPLAGDLVQGEPALDLTNKRLYTEDSGGTVIEVGTNPGTDVTFADNRKAIFGAGSDLQIYHDGSASFVSDQGSGNLRLLAQNFVVADPTNTEAMIVGFPNGSVDLYYDNAKKLETTSTGIDVTGDVNSDSVTTGTFTSTGIDDNATSTAITIDSSENVGIGTTSTTFRLNVSSASSTTTNLASTSGTSNLRLTNSGGLATVGSTNNELHFTTSTTERMRIDSSGNVGIGTSSPTNKLDVKASTSNEKLVRISHPSAPTAAAGYFGFVDSGAGDDTGVTLGVQYAGDYYNAITIDRETQNVGIGTTSPDALLNLEAFQNPVLRLGSSDGTVQVGDILGTIEFYSNDTNAPGVGAKIYAEQEDQNGAAEGAIVFETGVTGSLSEIMRLNSDGLVGIGTTSPDSILHLSGSSGSKIIIEDSANPRQNYIGIDSSDNLVLAADEDNLGTSSNMQFRVDATERMRIDSSGNLLIGRTADSGTGLLQVSEAGIVAQFDRSSGTAALVNFTYGGVDAGFITSSAGGTPSFSAASDQRLKENIQDHASELANVNAIRTATWDWKDKAKGSGEGVIAQELQQTGWADLVSEGDDGFLQVAGINKVETRLIKAIQELSAQVNELKAEVAALKGA